MRVTQQDIAKLANVSQATVSRVLAGDERVEDEIRERVQDVVRAQNYRPDVRARSLRKQRTHLIGLVMKREHGSLQGDPFFSLLISEILDVLARTEYHLCVDIATSAVNQETVYEELLRSRRVDGLILVESEPRDERIHRLQDDDFPFVLMGNPNGAGELHSVDNDNVLAGQIATEHLVGQGYQRIGFIAGPQSLTVSKDRVEGYRRTLQAAGLPEAIWHCDFGFAAARDTARNILNKPEKPDALVVLDDFMAMGVVQAAREAGTAIPSQLGIVSFNDTAICSLVENGLTSVSLNIPHLVRSACKKLLNLIEDNAVQENKRTVIPCEIKVRGSSLRRPEAALQ